MPDNVEQRIESFDQRNGLEFVAWVDAASFDTKGDIKIKLTIPFDWRHGAMGIWDAMAFPVRVKVDRWLGPSGGNNGA